MYVDLPGQPTQPWYVCDIISLIGTTEDKGVIGKIMAYRHSLLALCLITKVVCIQTRPLQQHNENFPLGKEEAGLNLSPGPAASFPWLAG